MFSRGDKVDRSFANRKAPPSGEGEAFQVWVNGFSRPVIGSIVEVVVVEGEDSDELFFVINDGNEEVTINADTISATGDMAAFAA